jgi:hypothetical protein
VLFSLRFDMLLVLALGGVFVETAARNLLLHHKLVVKIADFGHAMRLRSAQDSVRQSGIMTCADVWDKVRTTNVRAMVDCHHSTAAGAMVCARVL